VSLDDSAKGDDLKRRIDVKGDGKWGSWKQILGENR
jgi:hypothetical protein